MSEPQIHGTVHPRFQHVADVFRANVTERDELGAAVALFLDGEPVVDLWTGLRDRDTGQPWERDTMAVMFSATKGLVALAFLMLEARGELDLDQPVSEFWPDFARGGKHAVTTRQLLNHTAGLCALDHPLTLEESTQPEHADEAVARQVPLWKPGTAQGYGATSYGIYTQSVFRRVAGETLGAFLRREVFGPLDADVHLGLPVEENHRVATVYPVGPKELLQFLAPKIVRNRSTEGKVYRRVLSEPESAAYRAFRNPSMGRERLSILNQPHIRALEIPFMNGIATARGLAKVYAALGAGGALGDVRLVPEEALAPVHARQSFTYEDRVLRKPLGYSQGFIKEEPHLLSPNPEHFGHTGAGGTVGFADPRHRLGFAYLMNRMDWHIRSPRCIELCRAVYRCLGDAEAPSMAAPACS